MQSTLVDWATFGLPHSFTITQSSCLPPKPRGSSLSAWNVLHGFAEVKTTPSPRVVQKHIGQKIPLMQLDSTSTRKIVVSSSIQSKPQGSPDRPFHCMWCDWKFRTLAHLRAHCGRKHPKGNISLVTIENTYKRSHAEDVKSKELKDAQRVLVSGFKRDREMTEVEDEEPDEFTISAPILEILHTPRRTGSVSSINSEEQNIMASLVVKEHSDQTFPDVEDNVLIKEKDNGISKLMDMFNLNPSESKFYQCPVCLHVFKQAKAAEEHIASHADAVQLECYFCMQEFDKSSELLGHLRTHEDPSLFTCPVCCKTFRKRSGLKTHLVKNHSKKFKADSSTAHGAACTGPEVVKPSLSVSNIFQQ